MTNITTVGLDLAKSVFQVHAADQDGRPVVRKKLRRGQVLLYFSGLSPCLIGLEACGSAHHWARELRALGHEVRLIPPQYVKPFVKTSKNDASDAEAICEALVRPTMRFAAVKSTEQQSVLMLHRARELLVRQRTMLINALRGHCGEFGIVVAEGASRVTALIEMIEDPEDGRLPTLACAALGSLVEQLKTIRIQILGLEKKLMVWHRANEASRRLEAIPGVGVITATALVATIGDATQFRSGRQLAAWLGLVPRQYSSGGKERRSLWQESLLARRPTNVVLVDMANKTARVVWAMLSRRETFRAETRAAA
jgi:transposase